MGGFRKKKQPQMARMDTDKKLWFGKARAGYGVAWGKMIQVNLPGMLDV
jgi:hypothetical protein